MKLKCLIWFKYLRFADGMQYCDKCEDYIDEIEGIHYLYPYIYRYVNDL